MFKYETYIIALTSLLLNYGCSSGSTATTGGSVTAATTLTITNPPGALAPNSTYTFIASGGTAPYIFSVVPGGVGNITFTGTYTAPSTAGGTAQIQVTDSAGSVPAFTSITISSTAAGTLALNTSNVNLSTGSNYTFSATGGTPPYKYVVLAGGVGSINQTSGVYTASSNGSAQVEVTDAVGSTPATATVSVTPAGSGLTINPSSASIIAGATIQFSGKGGSGSYSYTSTGTGSIQSSGLYTAPNNAETDTVTVKDSSGHTATATITVGAGSTSSGLVEVYRFYMSSRHDHFYSLSSTEGTSAGYSSEGASFQVLSASGISGTSALYRCRTSSSRHLLSLDSGCEGNITESIVGYVYLSQTGNYVPLYRFIGHNGYDHLETLNYNEGAAAGYNFEGTLGYVAAP